jgi:hypothetical protein
MRDSPALTITALAAGVLMSVASASSAGGGCPPVPARVAAGPPAPVVVSTLQPPLCAVRVLPDGRTRPAPWRPTGVRRGLSFPLTAPELVVLSRRGRIVVARANDGRVLWRSHDRYPQPGAVVLVTGVAASPTRVAFSVLAGLRAREPTRLYIAPIGGPEQIVAGADGESPVGWTPAGELVTREGRATLRLRAADGRLRALLVRGARWFDWDHTTRTAVVAQQARLRRVGSGVDRTIAEARTLRLEPAALSSVEVVERGRIVLVARRSLVVLRPDGSLWARAAYPRGGEIAGQGSLTTSPDSAWIAFVNVRHRAGSASVELLGGGDRRSRRLLSWRFVPRPHPNWSAGLRWRGQWLLAWTTEGQIAVLHPGIGVRARLDGVGRALARPRAGGETAIEARWAEQ